MLRWLRPLCGVELRSAYVCSGSIRADWLADRDCPKQSSEYSNIEADPRCRCDRRL